MFDRPPDYASLVRSATSVKVQFDCRQRKVDIETSSVAATRRLLLLSQSVAELDLNYAIAAVLKKLRLAAVIVCRRLVTGYVIRGPVR